MAKTIVGEVCLYGNRETGAGYIAVLPGRMFGDGTPVRGRSMTEAVWFAAFALRDAGAGPGLVRVHEPDGRLMADVDIDNPGYFGDLPWVPAAKIQVSMDALMAMAERD